jgi:hypothetical protein
MAPAIFFLFCIIYFPVSQCNGALRKPVKIGQMIYFNEF